MERGRYQNPISRYTVYDNRTDALVIVDGTSRQAAAAMGLTLGSFYSAVTRARQGKRRRWHIKTTKEGESV